MWDTRQAWTAAAWFIVLGAGAAGLRGQAADEDLLGIDPRGTPPPASSAPSAAPKCPECGGKREIACPDCRATGKVARACEACGGSRKVVCPSEGCSGGQKRCKRCGGTGQQPSIGPRGAGFSPCAPTIRCDLCSATGQVDCKKCRKLKGSILEPCPTCQGKKVLPCSLCQVDEATVNGPAQPEVEVFDPLASEAERHLRRLQSSGRQLEKLVTEIKSLQAQAARLQDRIAGCEPSILALGPRTATPRPLQEQRSSLDEMWERCEASRSAVKVFLGKLPALEGSASSRLAELRVRLKALASSPGKGLDEIWLQETESDTAADAGKVADGAGCCERLQLQLERLEKELPAYRRAVQDHEESQSRAVAETRARERTFQQVARSIKTLAPRHGFEDVTCQLLPSKSALDLEAELVLLDAGATVDGEEPLPSEAALTRLVGLVSGSYRASPELMKLRIRVDGNGLGDTGLPVRREVQRFTTERGRWEELTSGAYSQLPLEILQRCRPAPPYPRVHAALPTGAWPIIALVALLFVAVCLVFVARTRMMS